MSDAVLIAEGIWRTFGSHVAVRDLTFSVPPGEVIGLLGPNGAGKTSAIRVLTTVLSPSRGHFSLDGIPHTRGNQIRSRIGVLAESSGYPLHMTGLEYLRYFARLYGHAASRAKDVAQSLLAEVGLEERAHAPISTYSRGMRQRLGVARAMVNDPKVIFLDEPTLGLDPAGQHQILRTIQDVAEHRNSAVILSTHFLDEVEQTCSRALILNRGRVVAEGTIDEIKRAAAAPRTGRFQVVPEMHEKALDVLRKSEAVESAEPAADTPGVFTVTLGPVSPPSTGNGDGGMNPVLAKLVGAGVPVSSFEMETSRLSDAFLSLTAEE